MFPLLLFLFFFFFFFILRQKETTKFLQDTAKTQPINSKELSSISMAKAFDSKIEDKNVLKVVYPKNKYKENKYCAIGICRIILDKSDNRNSEKCAFSQYTLSNCDSISALIYSDVKTKDSGNNWKYLCDGDFSKIHLFDSDYLKQWIDLKGCEYIHCPLCKTGIIFFYFAVCLFIYLFIHLFI